MKSSFGSKTLTIGELSLRLKAADLSGETIDNATASEFDVEVEFDYTPGHPGNLSDRWEDAEEPIPDELEITAIKADSNVIFEGDDCTVTINRGTDLMKLFTGAQVSALEDRVLKMIESGNDE